MKSFILDQKVTLTLTHMDIVSASDKCLSDSLRVLNGDDETAPEVAPYCGTRIPPSITSSGSQMVVIFQSDTETEGTGFRATYSSSVSGGNLQSRRVTQFIASIPSLREIPNFLVMLSMLKVISI